MLTLRVSDPDPIVLGLGEEQEAVLTAEPAVYVSIADYYEGPYTVTPGTEAVTLETDGYTMSDDVTVEAVPVGSDGVPVATKGSVSNHQIAVTPSVTNTAGLIEGGTRTGASVTVSASELVSGTYNVTSAGTKDVTNYASASVPSGSAGTPTASKVIVPEDVAAVITPSVTNSTGYITGGTKTGSNVVVTARELVSGNTLICDEPGNWDVADIETFTVPSGSAGTPTASKGAVSNHAVTVTPSVTNTAGYISSGTRTGAGVSVTAAELVSGTKSITANGTGIDVTEYAAVDVAVPSSAPSLQTKSASYTPTTSQQTDSITADVGFDGIDTVNVTIDAVPVGSIIQGYINGDFGNENNTRVWYPRFDFEAYGLFSGYDSFSNMGYYLAVPANTTVTPTETAQTVGGNGYMMEDAVTVSAIPSNYVGSGITRRDSTDLTASGATVTAPAGYYSASASKAVASGTEGTPTATKSAVNNHALTVTPSVTNTAGYISGGTHTGTAVSVTAAELVSGTYSVTSSGTKDVTNYASASVPAGSATPAANISGTSATVSTGTNTITLSKTVSNTPQVSAGYVSSGTAGNSNVSLTANVTTKGATTYAASTSDQTIAGDTYLTGTQTIKGYSVQTKTFTENGTYTPDVGYNGFSEVTVNVSGGGGGSIAVRRATTTLGAAADSIQFTGLSGNPTTFAVTANANVNTNTNGVTAVVYDGSAFHGQIVASQAEAETGFSKTYSNGTLTITATSSTFQAIEYKLVYSYGGSSADIGTEDVQVGSGATSIAFPVSGNPVYWSCIFKSNFGTSSGYQRVIEVVNDGQSIYGMAFDSSAKAQTSWSAAYSGGTLTITSQGTNNGGYFHQPGYYQLTYAVDASAPQYQTKTVTPTTSTQTVTADAGYDALSQVTVNPIPPEYIIPSGNLPITANANNINVAQYATVSVNVPSGGSSKNAQVVQQGNTRINATSYTKACGDITVSKTGTYDVYWSAYRTSTSGTWGTQLYIGNTAYGSAQATFSSYYQTVHLSNVSLTANQTVAVYGRSRGSNYYLYVGQLTIIEA